MLKKVSIPMAGLMLGIASLGNLLQSYSENIRLLCGIAASIVGVLLALKIIVSWEIIKEELKSPIPASVVATFSMGTMLLSVYIKEYNERIAIYIWYIGIGLHIIILLYFMLRYIIRFDIKKVFASYFIPIVGLGIIAITAPAYGQQKIGLLVFWFAFISALILLGVVGYRYIKYKELPQPAQPLFCIFTAPISLCLTGYLASATNKSYILVVFIAILASALYILALINLPKFLKLPFYPSYSSFTFPFVISAIAMKQTMKYMDGMGITIWGGEYIVLIETVIATLLVLYVIIRYGIYLCEKF
jgi:Tellurite resistance protein and related permeases